MASPPLKIFPQLVPANIPVSTNTSAEIDLGSNTLAGIILPSTFDGTTLTFQMSPVSGGTYVNVQDGVSADFSITTAASKYTPIANDKIFKGIRFLKVVTGSSQTTTDTLIQLVTRPLY